MEIEQPEQQSVAWHVWREKGIGSSDAPAIMGVSPWRTPYQLWVEKCGLNKREGRASGTGPNWAIQRGNDLEPVARSQYEMENDWIDMPATLVEHATYPFLRASLDGYNKQLNRILEIKCPGKSDHQTALDGKVPEKYWPQLMHQLLVTGAERADYYSFDGVKGVTVIVYPDLEYCAKLLAAELAFWENVQKREPPPLIDKDVKRIRDRELKGLMALYAESKAVLATAEENVDRIKKQILEHPAMVRAEHPHIECGPVRVSKVWRRGAIEYAKVPELKGVDLEPYRKKATQAVTFYVVEEKQDEPGPGGGDAGDE